MYEHEVAKFVNDLTDCARKFGRMGMLREKIRAVVLEHIDVNDPDFECSNCHTRDIDENQRFCPHCGACNG